MKTIVLLCTLAIALAAAENPISLNPQQRTKLMELIKTDKEAKARFETLKRAADKALNDKPNPIRVIQGEGKLKTDPLAIKTRESLGDMRKMYFFAYTKLLAATHSAPLLFGPFPIPKSKICNQDRIDSIVDHTP